MNKLTEQEIKELEKQKEKEIPLYSFHVNLTPEGDISMYAESSDAAGSMRERYGNPYEQIENMLIKDIEESIVLYGNSVSLIKGEEEK